MRRLLMAAVLVSMLALVNLWSATAAVRMPFDPSFGYGGLAITDVAGGAPEDEPFDLLVEPDGKLALAGKANGSASQSFDFALLKYLPNGSLDTSFESDGIALTDFLGGRDEGMGLARQPDGKIVETGMVTNPSTGQVDVGAVRYNTDGSLDTSFGAGGKVITDFAGGTDMALRVVVQADGKIVAGGMATGASTGLDFALVRYNTDGSLDTLFGNRGWATTDFFGRSDVITDMELLPNGKFVVVGAATNPYTKSVDFALARYNSNGSLDTSFATYGAPGVAVQDFFGKDDVAYATTLQPDGKIVVGGLAFNPYTNSNDVALARFNADGSLDTTFATYGAPGVVTTDFAKGYDQSLALAIQPDGKILSAGHTVIPGRSFDFALVRYNPDGTLDPTFGWGGRIAIDVFGGPDGLHALALLSDGKAVVAGDTYNPNTGGDDFVVARLLMADPAWIAGVVSQLPDSDFAAGAGQKTSIIQVLDTIEAQITAGMTADAITALQSLRSHMDGCGAQADGEDWIIDCPSQEQVRGLIDQLIGKLGP